MDLRWILLLSSLFFCTAHVHAKPLITPLDKVTWQYVGDKFNCQLTTEIEGYGQISIVKTAGYELELQPASVLYQQDITNYRLGYSAAPWNKKQLPPSQWFHLTQAVKSSGKQHISTDVIRFLRVLQQGVWGHINLVFANEQHVHIVLPAVNRGMSFNQFFKCMSELAPYSYEQVRDRNFYFAVNEYLLSSLQQKDMQLTARYIAMESHISKILIDGHSDASGSIADNLRLSQQRADDMYTYLLELGVSKSLIEVRSHGARFPIADNATVKGRQKNRRVNLRIIRQKID